MTAPADASIYYGGDYWNDLPEVSRYINRRVSGDESVDPWAWFQAQHAGRTFERALVLNAGNGWVERNLIDRGLIASAVSLEYLPELVAEATQAAGNRPLTYVQHDINHDPIPDGPFDLVVNHAACHHIARLDRVFRAACALLPEDGVLVCHDYIGPHRNQYPYEMWAEVTKLNDSLPPQFRKELVYPHLPTMLATDPTEAIHSELIVEVMSRYFDQKEFRPIGGGMAYEILTFNDAVHRASPDERAEVVATVLAADEAYTDAPGGEPLFAFFYALPRKASLDEPSQLAEWAREEEVREAGASEANGEYYERTLLQRLTNDLSDVRMMAEHRLTDLHRAMGEVTLRRAVRDLARRARRRLSRSPG
jgi:SAM-dependent methyltransferase